MNTRLSAELAHLIRLAETSPAWHQYSTWKAASLALTEPVDFNSLPVLLSNTLTVRKHGPPRSLRPSGPVPKSSNDRSN
jgi:hypothetical protein